LITELGRQQGKLATMKKFQHSGFAGQRQRQRGAVLVFCLVFLAVLTMMGVSGMESTILEERMSANMRDQNLAFQAAESALKSAEAWLAAQTTLPVTSGNGATRVWIQDSMDPAASDGRYWWDHEDITPDWWTNNGVALAGVDDVSAQPRYIIEEYFTVDSGQSIGIGGGEVSVPRVFHRITARAVGIAPTTRVSLQSTFVKPYD